MEAQMLLQIRIYGLTRPNLCSNIATNCNWVRLGEISIGCKNGKQTSESTGLNRGTYAEIPGAYIIPQFDAFT